MAEKEKLINKAKIRLFTEPNSTFWSALLANMRLKWTDKIPTAATDGVTLYLCENFMLKCDVDETLFVLLHEVGHVALDHINRCNSAGLDKMIYNAAGDFIINNDLDSRGYKCPENPEGKQIGLIDHKYDGWSTRQVYDDLIANAVHIECALDLLEPPPGTSAEEHQEKVVTNVIKAVTQAKIANDVGSIPGEIARRVEEILNPKLPWNQILMDYMSSYNKDDYTWRKPNRKYWPDVYMPGMQSENLNQITAYIDTSASIEQSDMDAFIAEVRYIFDVLKPKKLRIMSFDTRIRDDLEFVEGEYIDDLTVHGGGGTNLTFVKDTLLEDSPEVALIFSDLEVDIPDLSNITSDLFWIQIGNYNNPPNKGVLIQYD